MRRVTNLSPIPAHCGFKHPIMPKSVVRNGQVIQLTWSSNPVDMRKRFVLRMTYVLFSVLAFFVPSHAGIADPGKKLVQNTAPLFMENKGQLTDMNGKAIPHVWFKASQPGMDVYITDKGISYVLLKYEEEEKGEEREEQEIKGIPEQEKFRVSWEMITMELHGATLDRKNVTCENADPANFNFFCAHTSEPIMHVKKYGKISIRNVYPGIDWVLYDAGRGGFKYDFVVHPGADASRIRMLYRSPQKIHMDTKGNLQVASEFGNLSEKKPMTYEAETDVVIPSAFAVTESVRKNRLYETNVSFTLPFERSARITVIDPQLVWGTFYGGAWIEGTNALDTDSAGNIFSCGYTGSTNLPLQTAGTFFNSNPSSMFLMKFSNTGSLLWATYYPASGTYANNLCVDKHGNLFVTGYTSSPSLATQNASTYFQGIYAGGTDAFILKFDNSGNCLWATYYGGSSQDIAYGIDTDPSGHVFIVGTTSSTNLPVQNAGTYFAGPASGMHAFISKFTNNGTLTWASYFLYAGFNAVVTDLLGNVIIVGSGSASMTCVNPGSGAYFQPTALSPTEGGMVKFDNAGNLVWSTYFGGSGIDFLKSVVADSTGNFYVLGTTNSANLTLQNSGGYYQAAPMGYADVVLMKFNPNCSMLWGTCFGGTKDETLSDYDHLSLDGCSGVYASMESGSSNPPLIVPCDGGYFDNSRDTSKDVGALDILLTRFSTGGSLLWSTFLGGAGKDLRCSLARDKQNSLFVTGEWTSQPTPTVAAGFNLTYPITNPGSGAYVDSVHNGGLDDVYFVKFIKGTPFIVYPAPLCAGGQQNIAPIINGTPSGTFIASPSGLNINPQTGVIQVSGSQPGTYTISNSIMMCACGTSLTPITATFVLLAKPVLTVTGISVICKGNSVTHTASGAANYAWSTGALTSTVKVTPVSDVTLTVTGTAVNGCTNTATVSIKVNPCLAIPESATDQFRVFANPNRGDFIISGTRETELRIVNVLGQETRRVMLSAQNGYSVQVTRLPPGTYFIFDPDEKSRTVKILVD
jgi:hypothetical protein